jgi:hypothetical protein
MSNPPRELALRRFWLRLARTGDYEAEVQVATRWQVVVL